MQCVLSIVYLLQVGLPVVSTAVALHDTWTLPLPCSYFMMSAAFDAGQFKTPKHLGELTGVLKLIFSAEGTHCDLKRTHRSNHKPVCFRFLTSHTPIVSLTPVDLKATWRCQSYYVYPNVVKIILIIINTK